VIAALKTNLDHLTKHYDFAQEQRSHAIDALLRYGLPGKKDERWRHCGFTNVDWDKMPLSQQHQASIDKLIGSYPEISWPRIPDMMIAKFAKITNGHINFPNISIRNRLKESSDLLKPVEREGSESDCLGQIAEALMQEGLYIYVPEDEQHVIYVDHVNDEVSHLRHHIVLEKNSRLTMIELHRGTAWSNDRMTMHMKEGSYFNHFHFFDRASVGDFSRLIDGVLEENAELYSVLYARATERSRIEQRLRLIGRGAKASLKCASLACETSRLSIVNDISHEACDTISDQMYRSVLSLNGTTSCLSRVRIEPKLSGCISNQSLKALSLSPVATAHLKPELKILSDDVQCSHGATVSGLDRQMLFAILSRGIDMDSAVRMLSYSFIDPVLQDRDWFKLSRWIQNLIAADEVPYF